jgi:hypothetical protein
MGAKSGDLGSETASSVAEGADAEGSPAGTGGLSVESRSSHLVVSLPPETDESTTYHTSRLCPDYPVPAESVPRAEAEDEGHTFCWTCFELEMRAIGER